MTAGQHDPDPLFDGGPHDDATLAALEATLGGVRYRGEVPAMPRRIAWRPFPLAAAAVLLVALGWLASQGHLTEAPAAEAWAYVLEDERGESAGRLRAGTWLRTGEDQRARIEVRDLGHVDLAPSSTLRLVATAENEHRIRLEQGQIDAVIDAPPRLFITETPAAEAVDLGCAYRLRIDEDGHGVLTVTAGWVALADGGREATVPADASCEARRGIGPGTPYLASSSPALREALRVLDFGPPTEGALGRVLAAVGPADTLTLWHLLDDLRRPRGERERVLTTLEALVELPVEFTREGLLGRDDGERKRLFEDLALDW